MDKRSIIGFVLIAVVLIGFSWYSQPSKEELRAKFVKDSIAQAERQKAEEEAKVAALNKEKADQAATQQDTTALFYAALNGTEKEFVLNNNSVQLTLTNKGAQVKKALVKHYEDDINGKEGVTLFDGKDQNFNITLATKDQNISTDKLYFEPSDVTDSTVVFTATAAPGKYLTISYKLDKNHLLKMDVQAHGMEGLFAPNTNTMAINWRDKVHQQEKGFTFENRYSTLTYHYLDGGTNYLSETSEKIDKDIDKTIDWVAFKNQFFSAIFIAKTNLGTNSLLTSIPQPEQSKYLKFYEAKMKSTFDPSGKTPSEFEFYFGPNDFRLLQEVNKESSFGKNLQLERIIYFGWPVIRYINRYFTIYVFDWLSKWFPMGVVLILITLLLKAITFPMVKKSYMSSAKMRVLKPIVDEATKQFNNPDDQLKKQQAMTMEYSKYGASPFSGCLPMLIQLPVWIAMFNFIPNAIQLRDQSFLWMKDLSSYDAILEWHQHIWLIGNHLSLTCILFCGAQIIYTWFSMQMQKDQMIGQQAEQMKVMNYMTYAMPIMFFFMFNDYASGLNFYYFVSMIMSAAIMFVLRKTTNEEKLLAKLKANYKKNESNPKKMKGLMARMQALQEMQIKQMEEQKKRQQGNSSQSKNK